MYIGTAQGVCSTAIFWFTVLLTSTILLLPIVAYRFIKLDITPTMADQVRIVQKYGIQKSKSSSLFATRPKLKFRESTRSYKRSAYAFSHTEGFAALIREGKMMAKPKVNFIFFLSVNQIKLKLNSLKSALLKNPLKKKSIFLTFLITQISHKNFNQFKKDT